jgi:zinc D-Ala-D-Ala dipeptidase
MFHNKNPEEILVDVIALSEKRCDTPIRAKLRFATSKNFIGVPIDGYNLQEPRELCLLSRKAAEDLCRVQNYLSEQGYSLFLYDAYRPQRSVTHFWQWSQSTNSPTKNELARKRKHYPLIPKEKFFELGYVAKNSTHCYGNTLDVELVDLETNKPLFMGARISYMGTISHSSATADSIKIEWNELKLNNVFDDIKKQLKRSTGEDWQEDKENLYLQTALDNRNVLSNIMQQFGFSPYEKEWWHYSHKDKESDDAMDLPISSNLKGLGVK